MKLGTNNRFSKWLYKLACRFGYSPKPNNMVYIAPNLERCCIQVKVPEYPNSSIDYMNYIKDNICYEFAKNATFRQNIEFTSRFNPVDNTTTIYAKLFILNKKGLEDFYGRY